MAKSARYIELIKHAEFLNKLYELLKEYNVTIDSSVSYDSLGLDLFMGNAWMPIRQVLTNLTANNVLDSARDIAEQAKVLENV